jgi:amino acid permease
MLNPNNARLNNHPLTFNNMTLPEPNHSQTVQRHLSAPLISPSNVTNAENITRPQSIAFIKRSSARISRRKDSSSIAFSTSHRFSSVEPSRDDYDEQSQPLISGELSIMSVSINLIKCAVGAGSFSLPNAFLKAGFFAGIVLCLALGLLAAFTVHLLTTVERRLASEIGHRLRYPDLALLAFNDWRGSALRYMCLFGVMATSLGVCAVYVIFISSQLQEIITGLATTSLLEIGCMLSPFIIGLALLRSFKYLVFTSILGDVAVLVGLVGTLFIGFSNGIKASPFKPVPASLHSVNYYSMNATSNSTLEYLPSVNWSTLPEAAGSIAFLFCIHVVVLPVSQSLRGVTVKTQQKDFKCVIAASYISITLANAAFGAVCVCLFGLETQGNVLKNLASSGTYPTLVLIIRILLCIDLLFTVSEREWLH